MNELDHITVGDWLAIVSTSKASGPLLQQVTAVTAGLVKTKNYAFRKDGRAFFQHYKSLNARPATEREIEKWQSRQGKSTPKSDDERPEVALARYLTTVSADDWARLGVAQLKRSEQR